MPQRKEALAFIFLFALIGCGKSKKEIKEGEKSPYFSLHQLDSCTREQVLSWDGEKFSCLSLKGKVPTFEADTECKNEEILVWEGSALQCRSLSEIYSFLYQTAGCKAKQFLFWQKEKNKWVCRNDPNKTGSLDVIYKNRFLDNLTGNQTPYVKRILVDHSFVDETTQKVNFTIKKKKASYLAKEISKTYDVKDLENDFLGNLILPVFGLYHDYSNRVQINIDSPERTFEIEVLTEPTSIKSFQMIEVDSFLSHQEDKPSFDFILFESERSGAFIMDIDGEVRWHYPIVNRLAWSSLFEKNKLLLYYQGAMYHVGLDWSLTQNITHSSEYTNLMSHHQMTKGKHGYLVLLNSNRRSDRARLANSSVVEVDLLGNILRFWDVGDSLTKHMKENGDNPDLFVRKGKDWFHANSAIYTNEEDNSLIISGRENFVVKLDYDTSEVRWIFGDETKYWGEFPSLKSLALQTEDPAPIGQHALSLVDNDPTQLLLFNNGSNSLYSPEGENAGMDYLTSKPMIYKINDETRTAKMTWSYSVDIWSRTRSSVQRSEDGLYTLVMYSYGPYCHIIDKDSNLLLKIAFSGRVESTGIWKAQILEDVFSY